MKLSRRRAFGVAAAVVAAPSVARLGWAQGYPSRPLRVIVPVATGGANDTTRACLRKNVRKAWGNSSTWKNLPGAGGNLGIASAARAPVEGYRLPAGGGNLVINPSLYAKIPYDPHKDFAAVSLMCSSPHVLAVHPSLLEARHPARPRPRRSPPCALLSGGSAAAAAPSCRSPVSSGCASRHGATR